MRSCFITPIPELALASKLLDTAGDALLLGDRTLAATLVAASDFPAIASYTKRILGPLSEEVHRQTKLPTVLPKSEREGTRMPTKAVERQIFERDGWRCRFCGVSVVCRLARKVLLELFPEETHWVAAEYERHSALYATAASLDHVVPHSRGGNNEIDNLVTACYCCQFGRTQYTLEEVGFSDPRERPPTVDGWDGLTRILGVHSGSSCFQVR